MNFKVVKKKIIILLLTKLLVVSCRYEKDFQGKDEYHTDQLTIGVFYKNSRKKVEITRISSPKVSAHFSDLEKNHTKINVTVPTVGKLGKEPSFLIDLKLDNNNTINVKVNYTIKYKSTAAEGVLPIIKICGYEYYYQGKNYKKNEVFELNNADNNDKENIQIFID